jgi:PIN domain nuclease of toxin-antitoxin system
LRRLFDTQLLVWALVTPQRLSPVAARLLTDPDSTAIFSAVSVWEVAIKSALKKPDFDIAPDDFLEALRETGFDELPVFPEHTLWVTDLPGIHKDPFDRLLIAQAMAEDAVFVTADKTIATYPGNIFKV